MTSWKQHNPGCPCCDEVPPIECNEICAPHHIVIPDVEWYVQFSNWFNQPKATLSCQDLGGLCSVYNDHIFGPGVVVDYGTYCLIEFNETFSGTCGDLQVQVLGFRSNYDFPYWPAWDGGGDGSASNPENPGPPVAPVPGTPCKQICYLEWDFQNIGGVNQQSVGFIKESPTEDTIFTGADLVTNIYLSNETTNESCDVNITTARVFRT